MQNKWAYCIFQWKLELERMFCFWVTSQTEWVSEWQTGGRQNETNERFFKKRAKNKHIVYNGLVPFNDNLLFLLDELMIKLWFCVCQFFLFNDRHWLHFLLWVVNKSEWSIKSYISFPCKKNFDEEIKNIFGFLVRMKGNINFCPFQAT